MWILSRLKRFWPLMAILAMCVAAVVIGGDQSEVAEYRVVTGWDYGVFLSPTLEGSPPDLAAVRTRDRSLHVAWVESDRSMVKVCEGGHDGLTWSEPEVVMVPGKVTAFGHWQMNIFEDSSGRLWLAWSVRLRDGGPSQIWVSVRGLDPNEPEKWSVPRQVTKTEDWYKDGGTLRGAQYDCYRPAFAELDGTVWLHWISNRQYHEGWIWRMGSSDGGDSWSEPELLQGSPYYQAFLQTSDGSLWLGGTATQLHQSVWIAVSTNFGEDWSRSDTVGVGAFPRISQVGNLVWITWQNSRYSPTVEEIAPNGADGLPYIWEIQTEDIWFSTKQIADPHGEWSREAKLFERDSHENSGIVLEAAEERVAVLYVTSEGLEDQYHDPPSHWRIRVATNKKPLEPIATKTYKEKRIDTGAD